MKKSLRKYARLIILVVGILMAALAKQVFDYAAPPTKEKDSDFAYPDAKGPDSSGVSAVSQSDITLHQRGGTINDASHLNKTAVHGVAKISSVDDIKNALQYARARKLKVTCAGQQHSMGGHTFIRGGLVLDMKGFKSMKLDKVNKVLTVESGAIWADVQKFLDAEGLSVKAMQSINIFTVGGTLSVNAHGIAHDPGQIAPTVRSLRVMFASGEIKAASPTQNRDLFRSVLGGYGLCGVILDVDLDVVDNEMYQWTTQYMSYKDFPSWYKHHIEGNKKIGLFYGRLSVSPFSYLTEASVQVYEKIPFEGSLPVLQVPRLTWISRLVINFSKTGGVGRWVRWMLEKHAEPKMHLCHRNLAMSQPEVCVVSRNQEMYDAMGYLKNRLKDTDILQEYFIPHHRMAEFVDGLRETVKKNGANLLNVTIRIVTKDTVTALPYAKEDRFAFVLYFNQKFNERESLILQKTTADLIDVATRAGGTYYLPYQLYYSPEQLRKAYPEVDAFFATKKKYDPEELLTNKFYEKYGKGITH